MCADVYGAFVVALSLRKNEYRQGYDLFPLSTLVVSSVAVVSYCKFFVIAFYCKFFEKKVVTTENVNKSAVSVYIPAQ